MAKFSEQLPRRLRRKHGLNPPPSIAPTTPAQSTDVDLEMRRRTVLASDAYDSTNSKKRDAAQCAAVHNAIWFQLLSRVPARFLQPLMDLVIDLEDHDRGLTVARFAPREKQGDFDSSLKWTARAHLVGLVYARYRIDGKSVDEFDPTAAALGGVECVYEELPGWNEEIVKATDYGELPAAARAYVDRVEQLIGRPVGIISVGPEREQTIFHNTRLEGVT